MGEEQHPKTLKTGNGDVEKQPESRNNENNDNTDPTLDRTTSIFSVATSPTPSPKSLSDVFGNTPRWSMMSGSPLSGGLGSQLSFPERPSPGASPLQSPTSGYDPKRIPSSIFARKSGTGGGDWSGGSNESLFSIHVGNGSISNGGELSERKSVSSLSPLAADSEEVKVSDASQVKGVVDTPKPSSGNATPSSQPVSPSPANSNAPPIATFQSPRMSTGSVNSCQSFAFPVLVKDVSKKPGVQPQPEPQSQSVTTPPQPEEATPPETPKETSKAAEPSCFTCFCCCWPRCC
ncbi:PREDICTED: proline-rich protein 12-like [Ipomoea nil]|uniref:proline-rich protein 12-like n=1 Tax=Ipomoea nil TaxID=35883 RepID=UPI0009017A36|nr:PREDICTED: proline-rich protein 12-like [Ipomoea nil]XP_019185206.1 PREDICTED: proline-rich protein 12-like [Ipomoea nil]